MVEYQIDVKHVKKIQGSVWEQIKKTFNLRKGMGEPLPIYGHYGGVFKCGEELLVIHTDGVGTKLLVAQKLGKYDTVGVDAIAMSVNDVLCLGAESLVGVDYLALSKEDENLVSELMKGLVKGAEESSCVIIGGETAIVPDLLHDEKAFDLTFTVVGRIKKKPVTGEDVKVGDVLIGLESSGIHSNGYTLARKVLDFEKWGEEMLIPTKIYVKPVLEMIDNAEIHGIAHITGGAFSKLTRLNKEVGFYLDNMPKPLTIFEALAEKVNDTANLYKTFNMGIGMVVIADKSEEEKLHEIARKHGVKSYTIGKVVEKKGVFLNHEGKEIDLTILD